MGRHLKQNRNKYKKRRKRKLKETKREQCTLHQDQSTCVPANEYPGQASTLEPENDKPITKNNEKMPFERDPLYTSMLKYMKCKQNFIVMKVAMKKDKADNYLKYKY